MVTPKGHLREASNNVIQMAVYGQNYLRVPKCLEIRGTEAHKERLAMLETEYQLCNFVKINFLQHSYRRATSTQ